eukprot:COSAG05_NODE_287_length_12131_cov_3.148022_12_plen_79_part_00
MPQILGAESDAEARAAGYLGNETRDATSVGAWRPGVLQQFDSDGDGTLDESEVARMIHIIESRYSADCMPLRSRPTRW